ncbi:MAG: tRNA-dihydrouridine synthase [Candidatus Staskawiczbacteria bacterium]|nr:tRNA-dihydrouridine synthase [Candidatus Staskawiczbacteria bacterium]
MELGFWRKLKKPIMALAPMSGVTDEAFRLMLLKYGRPDVFWTEFVSAEGLFSKGRDHCLKLLNFNKKERPIVAQLFGAKPSDFEKAARLVAELGFDGVDINMGCPDRNIEKKGGGAALIKDSHLAKEIIKATLRGARGGQKKIPVSVKTRVGYKKNQIDKWIPALLEEDIAVLTVHFRTRNETYASSARWELAKEVVSLRNKYAPKTLILGNGDVKSLADARELVKKSGVDGVMVGRAVLQNPWFFAPRSLSEVGFTKLPTIQERLKAIIKHAEIFDKIHKDSQRKNGSYKQFDAMKKYFHSYAKGFTGAKELREKLMKVKNTEETKMVVKDFLK